MLRFIFVALCALSAHADPHCSIFAPRTLHSNSTYRFLIMTHDIASSPRVMVGIRGEGLELKNIIPLQPLQPLFATLEIPALKNGTYQLYARGISGISFESNCTLRLDYNAPHIFLQTDKALYKPGDLVRFRALFLNDQTKPAVPAERVTIFIADGKKNRIKRYGDIRPTHGVFKGELQLGEYPIYGDWQISVQLDGSEAAGQTFSVAEYVLPKFQVKLEAPKRVLATAESFTLAVEARYTFGKLVKGQTSISIGAEGASIENALLETQFIAARKEYLTVPIKDLLPHGLPRGKAQTNFIISALVEEEFTGDRRNATAKVEIMRDKYHINMPNMVCYKRDEEVNYTITVTDIDDRPIIDSNKNIHLSATSVVGFGGELEVTLDRSGTATIALFCPDEGDLRLTAHYDEQENSGSLVKINMGLNIPEKKQIVGKPTRIEVISDESTPYLVCTIFAHEKIVDSRIVHQGANNATTHTFYITPTTDMLPKAKVYVYYIKDNRFKLFKGDFEFEETFVNRISINASTTSVEPGDNVTLTVNTDTGSYVGLLAIDQSVSLLKTGNDLNAQSMLDNIAALTDHEFVLMTTAATDETNELPTKIGMRKLSDASLIPKNPRIRKHFPETWIFEDIENTTTGSLNIARQIPDTITSWFVSGFSLNPRSGIALTRHPTAITVFRPFFIATNLPYSVKRGEVLSVPIVVFNYINQTLQVAVSLEMENDEFEFVKARQNTSKCKRYLNVEAQDSSVMNFEIRPLRTGYITLKMTAISLEAGDAMHKQLRVVPEGSTVYHDSGSYIAAEESRDEELLIPADIIEDSEFIEVSVSGFIMSATLDTIDDPAKLNKLVKMPKGCGEQNMIIILPSILLLPYMESVGKSNEAVVQKAKQAIEMGYSRELHYKHKDGSFSAFGWKDRAGSTWLTAYVLRAFQQAAKYVHIDPQIFNQGYAFLVRRQTSDGNFRELGRVIDFAHMNDVGLTAYVLLTFLGNAEVEAKYRSYIDRGFLYIVKKLDQTEDLYALAVAAYALQQRKPLYNHAFGRIWAKLSARATISGEHLWWSRTYQRKTKTKTRTISHDVEVTSYILMALLDTRQPVLPIVKWLLSKRNAHGGFTSTQDTAVALMALTKYAERNKQLNANLNIDVYAGEEKLGSFQVNKENEMVVQKLQLRSNVRKLTYSASGAGKAIVQLSYRFNKYMENETPAFIVTAKPNAVGKRLSLHIFIEYIVPEEIDCQQSNMALLDVSLPTGYTAMPDVFAIVNRVAKVDRVETENDNTKVLLYFNSLNAKEAVNLTIEAERVHDVAEQKPAEIHMYDYYDSEQCSYDYYEVQTALEDLCENRACEASC